VTSPATAATSAGTIGTDQLVQAWICLWNGDLDLAPAVRSNGLQLHAARVDGAREDAGPDALTSWIAVMRTVFPDLRFDIEVGPFVDGDVIVLRWIASGHYAVGFPGASRPAGTEIRFTGTDILRVACGRGGRVLGQRRHARHARPAGHPAQLTLPTSDRKQTREHDADGPTGSRRT
jgi:hypothetical protein